jgi:hypothetical protein
LQGMRVEDPTCCNAVGLKELSALVSIMSFCFPNGCKVKWDCNIVEYCSCTEIVQVVASYSH